MSEYVGCRIVLVLGDQRGVLLQRKKQKKRSCSGLVG